MNNSQYNFSDCYVNLSEIPASVKVIDYRPEFSIFPEFSECPDEIVRIAIATGDIDGPFVRISDRDTMVRAVFDYLGISLKSEENKKLCEEIISYQNEQYLFAWLKYLEILNETEFTDWQLAKKHYTYFLKKANEPQGKDEDDYRYMKRWTEARERVKDLGRELKSIEAKLFPESKAAREAAMAEQKRKIKLYPEMYAQPYSVI